MNMRGATEMNKDVDMMTCDELKEEIIRMIKEIDNIEILEEIYHFVKNLLKAEN